MAAEPCIITVAITGPVPREKDDPALPISTGERIEGARAACEAGAAPVHVHVRDADGTPSSDPDKFAALKGGIRKRCPDIIVRSSTGGRGRALETGGRCRTGLEDDIRLDRNTLAPGNAALVQHVAGLAAEHGRPVATAEQARGLLGLAPVAGNA